MQGDSPVSWLMFFTLVSGLVIITGAFLMFLRSGRNRDIAARTMTGDDKPSASPTGNGALPDLVGIGVFAAIVMALLGFGFSQKTTFETAQAANKAVGGSTSGMAQQPGSADDKKVYQPANPAPDPRVPPSGSSAGDGASSGGRPEQQPNAK